MFRLLILISAATLLALIPMIAEGQPSIFGELSGELGPGVYVVVGNCQVRDGDTLRINPGTTFMHTGYYTWQIEGLLLAVGKENEPISFKRRDPIEDHRWGGFQFFLGYTGQSEVRWCHFDYCKKHNYPNNKGAAIYLGNVSVIIRNCTFTNGYATDGGAIYAEYSDEQVIDSCTFVLNNSGNGGGIYLDHCTRAVISNCYIGQNESESI